MNETNTILTLHVDYDAMTSCVCGDGNSINRLFSTASNSHTVRCPLAAGRRMREKRCNEHTIASNVTTHRAH